MCADKLTPTKERVGHTPGEWKVTPSTQQNYYHIEPGIALVFGLGKTPAANARLIAAAPDGLEAAELAYLALLRAGSSYRLRVQAELIALRNFIAKATGRSEQDVQDTAESMVAYE